MKRGATPIGAGALQGWAAAELPESKERPEGGSLAPLLDAITRLVPAPTGLLDADTKVSGFSVIHYAPS